MSEILPVKRSAQSRLEIEAMRISTAVSGGDAELIIDGMTMFWRSGARFNPLNGDWALFASLPFAARRAAVVQLEKPVTRQAVANVILLSHYWAQLRPDKFHPISVDAPFVDTTSQGSGTALCFSGGVDAHFALLTAQRESWIETPDWGVFVEGFDYPIGDPRCDEVLRHLRACGLPIHSVKTNWCSVLGYKDYGLFFTVGLATILHLFGVANGQFAADLTFGGDRAIVDPWGTGATINRMLSGGGTAIMPVGEHADRIEKVRALADADRLGTVLVCHATREGFENCDRCDKCLRTKLQLFATGADPTVAFATPLTTAQILRLKASSWTQLHFLRQTHRTMKSSAWRWIISWKISLSSLYLGARWLLRPLRRAFREARGRTQ